MQNEIDIDKMAQMALIRLELIAREKIWKKRVKYVHHAMMIETIRFEGDHETMQVIIDDYLRILEKNA